MLSFIMTELRNINLLATEGTLSNNHCHTLFVLMSWLLLLFPKHKYILNDIATNSHFSIGLFFLTLSLYNLAVSLFASLFASSSAFPLTLSLSRSLYHLQWSL